MAFDPKKPVLLYVLTNTVSGKRYVGITSNKSGRWRQHRNAKSGCVRLRAAIKKYGWDAFSITELAYGSWEEMQELEKRMIRRFSTKHPNGYNLTDGGDGTTGYKWNDEACRRMSLARKGRPLSPEAKAKLVGRGRGRVWDDAHKAIFAANQRGRKRSEDTRRLLRAVKRGKQSWGSRVRINGIEYPHMKAAGEALGVHKSTISWRAKKKWPGYEVLGRFPIREIQNVI